MTNAPVILITGASSGFGEATSRLFAQKGYRVVLAARRYDRLESLAREIEDQGGVALPVETDMAHLEQVQSLANAAIEKFGQIDVLFNNAGFGRMDWLEDLDARHDIENQIDVNVTGMIWMAQSVVPQMIQRRRGHVINMASVAGFVGTPSYTIYAATKHAIRGFSEALRREVGVFGVHVSTICPGGATTEFGEVAGIDRVARVSSPEILKTSSEKVARAVWKLTLRPRRMIVLPWLLNIVVWANIFMPGLIDWAIERLYVRAARLKDH